MQKAISIYLNSAGALLLSLASALFLVNLTSPLDFVPPRDPIFLISLNEWFWIIGGIAVVLAFVCLFSERPTFPAYMVIWLVFEYLVCRIGLLWSGCHSLKGYLGGFPYTFGISVGTASVVTDGVFAYLLFGSCFALWIERRLPSPTEFQKMFCPSCGGHVKFPIGNLGQKINCPHCKVLVTVRKPEDLLKMDCFFCKEHIEFPAHALGRKIKCPHCKMEIGLKEQSI